MTEMYTICLLVELMLNNTFLTQHLSGDHSSHTNICSLCKKCNLYEET